MSKLFVYSRDIFSFLHGRGFLYEGKNRVSIKKNKTKQLPPPSPPPKKPKINFAEQMFWQTFPLLWGKENKAENN